MYVLALWKMSDREEKVLTHENFPFLSKKAEKANVTTAHAASERYVFKYALCCSSPEAPPPLKLGQYNQRKIVPVK